MLESLKSIDQELHRISSRLNAGEPVPAGLSARARLGYSLKRRLYRLLWWQTEQLKSLVDVETRRSSVEASVLASIEQRLDAIGSAEVESRGLSKDSEIRLRLAEASSAKLQAVAKETMALDSDVKELQWQVTDLKRSLAEMNGAHLQKAEQERLQWEERLRQEAEARATQGNQMTAQLTRLSEQLRAEIAAREDMGALLTAYAQKGDLAAAHIRELRSQFDAVPTPVADDGKQQEQVRSLMQGLSEEAEARERLATRVSELGLLLQRAKESLAVQDRRLSLFLQEARGKMADPEARTNLEPALRGYEQHRHDSLYLLFEDLFRGSVDEIKARQAEYLPLLRARQIGGPEMPVLDLGCGRGEWLQLLREQGFSAQGVDSNEAMVNTCTEARLNVVQRDVIRYLDSVPDSTLGCVSCLHLVEHLPFDVALDLVAQIRRVLKPGGMILLETPNPQNLLVSSYSFHLDPSHQRPLPPPMLRFFVEAIGFCEVQALPLHPYPDAMHFPDDGKGMAARLNEYFYSAQDYAVVGYKP